MDLIQKISDSISNSIILYLNENKVEFFIGGSKRFNYNNEYSDTDIFIDREHFSWTQNIYDDFITQCGFNLSNKGTSNSHSIKNYPTGAVYEYYLRNIEKPIIHVILMNTFDYKELKEEHNNIDIHITSHPELVEMAKNLKREGIKGAQIYRSIRAALFNFSKNK